MEEKDLGKRCVELGSLLTSTGRPFTILLRMEGFVFQLESSKFPPPQVLQMAARPYNRAHRPPTISRGGAELQSSVKNLGTSRSRRDARRRQSYLLKKGLEVEHPFSLPPPPVPTSNIGGGQAEADVGRHTSGGEVMEGLDGGKPSPSPAPASISTGTPVQVATAASPSAGGEPAVDQQQPTQLTKRGRSRPPTGLGRKGISGMPHPRILTFYLTPRS